jgi:hypothetical protein
MAAVGEHVALRIISVQLHLVFCNLFPLDVHLQRPFGSIIRWIVMFIIKCVDMTMFWFYAFGMVIRVQQFDKFLTFTYTCAMRMLLQCSPMY